MPQTTVVVIADDPIIKQGADAYLRTVAELRLTDQDALPTADVVLVFATRVTEGTMNALRRIAVTSRNPDMRMILVVHDIGEPHVLRAVEYGMTTLLLRPDSDYGRIVEAITDPGHAVLPRRALRSVCDHLRRTHAGGRSAHGFSERDIAILKMLADGAATAEIADRLQYSERTIKNVINAFMKRLELRNRAHAVSYALRAGLL
ncbi:response regulator transcription factor [Actinoplanes sp. NEAU-A12]|uniref:Response regulator transcription factor n=1 Tax=Actinoplanes sandaracinus TaxID=3045177 RepID=A0ABT6WYN6_9ACTN|nr:response regulator transcription factor [Actinoplanes sandaracinus]MDI6104842.1 response regulator transcription factor [Actinoplanes sandaracinus]